MKQLKNEVTILTGAKSRTGKRSILQLAGNGEKIIDWNKGEAYGNSIVEEKSKAQRETMLIKAQSLKPENYKAMDIRPATPSFIDIAGTAILVGVILTILIQLLFYSNGIYIAKPIFR